MKVDVKKLYMIELTEEDVNEFIEMMNDWHENRPPDMALLYKIEDFYADTNDDTKNLELSIE